MTKKCALFICIGLVLSVASPGIAETSASFRPPDTREMPDRPKVPRSEAFFGVHFDLHPGAQDTVLGRDATAENIGTFLDAVKPDFVQYDCKGHAGYTGYPTKVGYASPGIVKDALRLWREETRERGVGLYIHYSGVWDSVAVQHHPEWARIDENGNPDKDITSRFGGYASDLMIPQLKEVTSEYDLDGVWVDGDCWGAKLDYGTTAVAAWKAQGYNSVPKKPDDKFWQEWKAFHRDAFENYLVNWVDELHAFNPQLELCSNWAYTPHMPEPIKANVDFLSGDFSAKESVDRARFEARYLDSSRMPWDLMAWGFNGHAGAPGAMPQMKNAEQLKQEAAVVLALGGGMQVYFQPTRSGHVSRAITKTVQDVGEFCRARQAISHKSRSIPQVALLLSTESYLHRSNNVYSPHGLYNALEGALHALLDSGYSVDLLSEHQLAPEIDSYPVLVIAQAGVLKGHFRDRVLKYVRDGGTLVLLDRESLQPFKEYLGVDYIGEPKSVDAYVADHNGIAPVPGEWQEFRATTATVVLNRTDRNGDAAGIGQWPGNVEGVVSAAAATSATLGAGSIVAVYGAAPQAYFDSHNPVVRHWIGELLSQAFTRPKAQIIDCPNVDLSLRKSADGQETAHLVNLSGAQRADRFAVIDKIPGSGRVRLDWELARRPKRFRIFPGGNELAFEGKPYPDGAFKAVVTVENVPIHSIVVPEF